MVLFFIYTFCNIDIPSLLIFNDLVNELLVKLNVIPVLVAINDDTTSFCGVA